MGWQRSPGVVYEVVDGQAVLVDPDGVELITLNAVGTLVWEELDRAAGPAQLVAALHDRLEGVTADDLERDVAEFLVEMEAAGLVRRREPEDPGRPSAR
jgi:hypothetical protein